MVISVRLFAGLRERAGRDCLALELEPGATVADALEALDDHHELGEALRRMRVLLAVNRSYAREDQPLRAGDEVALIPPVSGGGGAVHARVTEEPLSPEDVTRAVRRPAAGAIVTFQGTTRDVERLDYEAYQEMAEESIAAILRDCLARHGLEAVAAEHRTGAVALGEPSVVVAAAAAHREQAFAGAREAIDRIKAQAPIWKREVRRVDGREQGRWVEGTVPERPETAA